MSKIFVLDTSVIHHDPHCIQKFQDSKLYIPLAVLDELDGHKTLPGGIGYSAREFFRQIDKYNLEELVNFGVEINPQGGSLHIINNNESIKKSENADNTIIDACLQLKTQYPSNQVILVTKDTGLRVRAAGWGVESQNYRNDLIEEGIYTGIREIEVENYLDYEVLWEQDYLDINKLSDNLQSQLKNLNPNEFIYFKCGNKTCPGIYTNNQIKILKDIKPKYGKEITYCGIKPKNLEQKCAVEVLMDQSISLISICGAAGCGKSICVIATSLKQVFEGKYDKIIYIKPIMPVGGKDIGFLPGDKYEKLMQWVGPLRDNIEQLKELPNGISSLDDLLNSGQIELEAMTYIQGRSIPKSIIIVDECSNLTSRECRMIVERCAEGTKIILLGDLSQIENPYLDSHSSGLAHTMNGGKSLKECAAILFKKVERSEISALASLIFKERK